MIAPDLEILFAWKFSIEQAWKTILDAAGLNACVTFSDTDPGTPRTEVMLQSATPTSYRHVYKGQQLPAMWKGHLISRVVSVRGKNSDRQAFMVGRILVKANDWATAFRPLLPFHGIQQLQEVQLVCGIDEQDRFDFSEITHEIVFGILDNVWPE